MSSTNWQAINLRIVLFTQQAVPTTNDLFMALTGEPPERQEDRPREGTRHQFGAFEGAQLQVTLTPISVSFLLTPPPLTAENLMGDLSALSLGDFAAEMAKLEKAVLTWLPRWEVPTTRVSFVATARASAPTKEAAYEVLEKNLKSVRIQAAEMSDLSFRINWRAKTELIPEGYFNKLTTWSALKMLVTASGGPGSPEISIQERHFAQVEMDINTPAERIEPLPREKLVPIYQELFQLADQIAELGEVQ